MRIAPLTRQTTLLLTRGALALAMTAVFATPARALQTVPGTTYTIHSVTTATGDGPMAAAMSVQNSEWTGVVVWAAGRGRMDITGKGVGGMFATGDYLLFDSTDFIVVHPAAKTFSPMPRNMGATTTNMMQSVGQNMTIKDVHVLLDTLPAGEMVAGLSTQHFRIGTSYSLALDLSSLGADAADLALPTMDMQATTEYWLAAVPSLPPNPFNPLGSEGAQSKSPPGDMVMSGAMKEIADKSSAAVAALPRNMVAIKTVRSSHISGGPMMSGGSDGTMEVSDIKPADVDLAQLVLPDAYVQTAMPGLEVFAAADTSSTVNRGAKWRVKPKGGR